jgi:hypothetical protein
MSDSDHSHGAVAPSGSPVRLPWAHLGLITLIFLACAAGRIGNADAAIMLEQSRSILEGKLSIAVEHHAAVGVGGLRYSQYGILTSVLWIPFVLAGRLLHLLGAPLGREGCEEFVVSFCAPLVMSGIFVALADVWRRLGADRQSMIRGIWILGLGSMLWSYANFPSSDAIMAAALLMTLREWLIRRDGRSEWIAGFWLGIALLSRKQAAVIAPVIILLWVIWRMKEAGSHPIRAGMSSAFTFAASLLPPLVVLLWYNWARFGSPFVERYPNSELQPITLESWTRAVAGLWISATSGLLWYAAPVVAGAVLGARRLLVRSPFLLVAIGLVVASQVAFVACLPYWMGGTTVGPRLLLFAAVLLAIPLGTLPHRLRIGSSCALWLAFGVGLVVTVPCVLTDPLQVHFRSELEGWQRNTLLVRNDELRVVLGLDQRPEQYSQHLIQTHRPFQAPNLWWAQIIRELGDRKRPQPAPDRSVR